LLVYEQNGRFSLADAQAAVVLYSQIIAEEGYLLLLLDFTGGGTVDPEVRRQLALWGKDNSEHLCIAAVGGNFVLRTTLTLVLTAMRVLGGRQPEMQFFAAREAAQAWLGTCSKKLAAELRAAAAPPP
jgi:hypothetical protein